MRQSFRVAGTITDIENIGVDNINGRKVIYWEDIEQVFPGVQHIPNGSSVVKLISQPLVNSTKRHHIRSAFSHSAAPAPSHTASCGPLISDADLQSWPVHERVLIFDRRLDRSFGRRQRDRLGEGQVQDLVG